MSTHFPSREVLINDYNHSNLDIVLYTSGIHISVAEEFAKVSHKRTYKDCWSHALISRRSKNIARFRESARVFGEVLAEGAVGTVWVLAPPSPADSCQFAEPRAGSVWASVEFPALKLNPRITRVVWVNKEMVYWSQ